MLSPAALRRPDICTYRRRLILFAGFALLLLALQILHLPENLRFAAFAFGEPGANMSAVYLVRHGLRPNVDFGHTYGLLPLFIANIWFHIAGLTPAANFLGIFFLQLAMCWATADFAVTAQLAPMSIFFLFGAFPVFVWVNYFNFAHPLETICFMTAVVAHLKRRYGTALAFSAAAVLARPALAYVYGLVLLCIVAGKAVREKSLKIGVLALPALTTILLAGLLAWRFSFASLLHTLLPITGVATYRATGYGFFNRGLAFWLPSPFKLRYYLDVPGFWLIVNISLLLLAPLALIRGRRLPPDSLARQKSEILAAASIVIFFWIFFGFGHQYIGSWILYLWLGAWSAALLPEIFRPYRVAVVLLIALAANNQRHQLQVSLAQWHIVKRSSLYANTLSQGNEDAQIGELFAAVQGHKTVILMHSGAAPLLHPGLGAPLTEFFVPGVDLPADEERAKSATADAEMVMIPTPPWYADDLLFISWGKFLNRQHRYDLVFRNSAGFVLK